MIGIWLYMYQTGKYLLYNCGPINKLPLLWPSFDMLSEKSYLAGAGCEPLDGCIKF